MLQQTRHHVKHGTASSTIVHILWYQGAIVKRFKVKCRLYTRITAAEVRRQLITQKQYTDAELPTAQTLNTKLNQLGYHPERTFSLKKVAKTQPQKRIPETDAIFAQLHQVHLAAAQNETVLRISMDAKAPVKIGPFARGGYNRLAVAAACARPTRPRLGDPRTSGTIPHSNGRTRLG